MLKHYLTVQPDEADENPFPLKSGAFNVLLMGGLGIGVGGAGVSIISPHVQWLIFRAVMNMGVLRSMQFKRNSKQAELQSSHVCKPQLLQEYVCSFISFTSGLTPDNSWFHAKSCQLHVCLYACGIGG